MMTTKGKFLRMNQDEFDEFLHDPVEFAELMAGTPDVIKAARRKADRFNLTWPGQTEDPPVSVPDDEPAKEPEAPEPAQEIEASRTERFVCNHMPHYSIGIGTKYVKFQGGVLVTDDPEIIHGVMLDPWFGIHIHPDNRELLAAAKWLKSQQ